MLPTLAIQEGLPCPVKGQPQGFRTRMADARSVRPARRALLFFGFGVSFAETLGGSRAGPASETEGPSHACPFQELSHATIDMYRSIGRTRSAQLLGKDLAEFYM